MTATIETSKRLEKLAALLADGCNLSLVPTHIKFQWAEDIRSMIIPEPELTNMRCPKCGVICCESPYNQHICK